MVFTARAFAIIGLFPETDLSLTENVVAWSTALTVGLTANRVGALHVVVPIKHEDMKHVAIADFAHGHQCLFLVAEVTCHYHSFRLHSL